MLPPPFLAAGPFAAGCFVLATRPCLLHAFVVFEEVSLDGSTGRAPWHGPSSSMASRGMTALRCGSRTQSWCRRRPSTWNRAGQNMKLSPRVRLTVSCRALKASRLKKDYVAHGLCRERQWGHYIPSPSPKRQCLRGCDRKPLHFAYAP